MPNPRRVKDVRMVSTCPRRSIVVRAEASAGPVGDAAYVRCKTSQVAPVGRGIHIDDRLHIIVALYGR